MLEWEVIPDFPDYAVSSEGEIANIKTGIPRKMSKNQGGIVKISIYRGKELHTRALGVLVAEAFCEGQTSVFNTPVHLDGDKENNRAANLIWRPRWFAVRYHRQFLYPSFHRRFVHFEDVDSGREYFSIKEACMLHGILMEDIYKSFEDRTPTYITGQVFQVIDEDPPM